VILHTDIHILTYTWDDQSRHTRSRDRSNPVARYNLVEVGSLEGTESAKRTILSDMVIRLPRHKGSGIGIKW
jgi:hypothetical protein